MEKRKNDLLNAGGGGGGEVYRVPENCVLRLIRGPAKTIIVNVEGTPPLSELSGCFLPTTIIYQKLISGGRKITTRKKHVVHEGHTAPSTEVLIGGGSISRSD